MPELAKMSYGNPKWAIFNGPISIAKISLSLKWPISLVQNRQFRFSPTIREHVIIFEYKMGYFEEKINGPFFLCYRFLGLFGSP